jgi:hypothetical protein
MNRKTLHCPRLELDLFVSPLLGGHMRGPIKMAVTAVVVVLGFLMFQYGGALFSGTLSGLISSPLRGQYLAP